MTHAGRVVTAGDPFLAVFHFPSDGATAALELHSRLAPKDVPGNVPLELRIGLHTGEARTVHNRYAGATLAHATRLRTRAHPRSTVVSANTAQLLRSVLGDGMRIVTSRGADGVEQLVLTGRDDEPERVTEPVSRPVRRVPPRRLPSDEETPSRRVLSSQALDALADARLGLAERSEQFRAATEALTRAEVEIGPNEDGAT